MRRFFIVASLTALAACSGTQAPAPVSVPQSLPPQERGILIGMTRADITSRFGQPDLVVQEGPGTKLQYRSRSCVVDFYLYAPVGGGAAAVNHVDTRDRDGRDVGQVGCVATFPLR